MRRPLVILATGVWIVLVAALTALAIDRFVLDRTAGEPEGPQVMAGLDLIDHTGRPVSAADFADRPSLMYFGYAFCPDVCPTSLSVLGYAMDEPALEGKVTPIFVTVDPERDTTEVIGAYVDAFHETMIGLTGTTAQTDALARSFGVYYRLNKESAADDDYLVDHASLFFLVDTEGRLMERFPADIEPADLASAVAARL